MSHFMKLVHFEISRFSKLYGLLLLVIGMLQTATTIILAKIFMRHAADMMKSGGAAPGSAVFNLTDVIYSMGFTAPIFIGIVALLFYMFFIWYRDWFARNAFIYRLLTLPTSRMTVFFAKLSTILLTVFGLISYQLVLLTFFGQLIKWIVPLTYRQDLSLMHVILESGYLNILIPDTLARFFISYGAGTAFVIIVFTMILFERSYKWKGIIIGGLYSGFCILIMLLPVIIQVMLGKFYLYPGELFFVELLLMLLLVGLSLWISRHLLKYKVTV